MAEETKNSSQETPNPQEKEGFDLGALFEILVVIALAVGSIYLGVYAIIGVISLFVWLFSRGS